MKHTLLPAPNKSLGPERGERVSQRDSLNRRLNEIAAPYQR